MNFGPDTIPSFSAASVDEVVFPDVGHYPWLEGDDFVPHLQEWMGSLR